MPVEMIGWVAPQVSSEIISPSGPPFDADVIAQTARGPALVHDQDLMALTRWLRDKDGRSLSDEALPEALEKPENVGLTVLVGKDPVAVKHLGNTPLPAHFGFAAQPQKPA